jgi:hypothetical protein
MQDLITKIVAETGLIPQKAEQAVGILLNLLETQGDRAKVADLFAAIPGAQDLAAKHGGGLMGMMAGGMMGGPLVVFAKLQGAGLNMDQIKTVATRTLQHAKDTAGIARVRAAAANIPGISGYL